MLYLLNENDPSKVVFHQRSSSIKGHLPSKVVFDRRSSSNKGHLPSEVDLEVVLQKFGKVLIQLLFEVLHEVFFKVLP